ncbi:uncharacterized protein LOC143910525 [Arctopsyche grandis]|uniref:uncharacterized protein LOC143910525 n=1 Tax=Arctopsyche grandis TaxID=121162 RepID=UPI00406D74B3
MAVPTCFEAKSRTVQWNQILSGTIFLICLSSIFPVAQSFTVIKNQKIAQSSNICYTNFTTDVSHVITCIDIDVNDATAMIEKEVEKLPNGQRTIDFLVFLNLSVTNGKLTQNWIDTTKFRITQLYINSENLVNIENNAFKGYAFEKLDRLRLETLKIDTLEEGTFEGLQSLTVLWMTKCEINHINENALKVVAPNLVWLYMDSIVLPINPVNLTGTVPLPKLNNFVLRLSNVGILDAGSLSQIENVTYVNVNSNQIRQIGCGTFEKMKSLQMLWLHNNLLTTLDSCVFSDEAINSLEYLWIAGNQWNCTCNLDWLKQLNTRKIFQDKPRCASHSDLLFDEVNFCDEQA